MSTGVTPTFHPHGLPGAAGVLDHACTDFGGRLASVLTRASLGPDFAQLEIETNQTKPFNPLQLRPILVLRGTTEI